MDKRHIPGLIFLLFSAKLLILSGNLQDVAFLAITAAYALFYDKFDQSKKFNELEAQIKELKSSEAEQNLRISEVVTHVGGLKLGQNMRFTK